VSVDFLLLFQRTSNTMAASDNASIFRGSKTVSNVVQSTSTMTNNQDQSNVCNQFIIQILTFRR
jgi:hypothetical protein